MEGTLNTRLETSLYDSVTHFVARVNNLFDRVLENVGDADKVGITIHNDLNQSDKPIDFSFRRKDQLSADIIWSVFDKVSQSNARFNATDTLIVTVHSVAMPVGFGGGGIKRKGRPLTTMSRLKRSVVELRAEGNSLAHALVIAKAKLNNDPNYKIYRQGRKTTGIGLTEGCGIAELNRFQ